MTIEGRKVIVNKSVAELKTMLQNPADYEKIMPSELQKFTTTENGFIFNLKGIPEIALRIDEVTDEHVVLSSAKDSLNFTLTGNMKPLSDAQTEVQLVFEGKFNAFIKMMVEKPLTNFIENLTAKLETL